MLGEVKLTLEECFGEGEGTEETTIQEFINTIKLSLKHDGYKLDEILNLDLCEYFKLIAIKDEQQERTSSKNSNKSTYFF